MTELDDQVVAEFRANGGVVLDAMGGHFSSVHLLLLHRKGPHWDRLHAAAVAASPLPPQTTPRA